MKCSVCGNELPENTLYCADCGHTEEIEAIPVPKKKTPARIPPSKRRKKKRATAVMAAVIASVLAVVLAAGIVIANLPIVQIPLALANSLEELKPLTEKLNVVMAPFVGNQAYSTSATLEFQKLNDFLTKGEIMKWSQFEGIVLQINGSMSEKDKVYSGDLTLTHNEMELLRADYGLDYGTAWLQAPALFGPTYGLKVGNEAEALKSLEALGLDTGLLKNLDLNYFNAPKPAVTPNPNPNPNPNPTPTPKPTEPAAPEEPMTLWELATSLKFGSLGKKNISINGHALDCRGYSVTIPQDVLTREPMKSYFAQATQVVQALYGTAVPSAGKITASGDLTLELYIRDGYVTALSCQLEMEKKPLTVQAAVGGTDTYINDLSVTLVHQDTATVKFSASGNHTGRGDMYATKVTQDVTVGTEKSGLSAELIYLPQAQSHNLSCKLHILEAGTGTTYDLEGAGQLTLEGKTAQLQSNGLSVDIDGENLCTLNVNCAIGALGTTVKAPEVQYVNSLDEQGILDVQTDMLVNAQKLVFKLMKNYPMLKDWILDQLM